jgi:hypothetical protein
VDTPQRVAGHVLDSLELGLHCLADIPLSEHHETAVLAVFAGYVSSQALVAGTVADGARMGVCEQDQATEAFGALLRTIAGPGRYPMLLRAVEAGALTPSADDAFMDFGFGLGLLPDGAERLIERQIVG